MRTERDARRKQVDGSERSSTDVTLTAAGLTLLGVILSIGVTVGFGVGGPWWVKIGAGAASSVLLVFIASWATSTGRGTLARLANWIIGANR